VLGTTGVLCLGVWAIASFILSLCFTCNLRAILLMPEYEGFVDTACDVVQHNLVRTNFFFVFFRKCCFVGLYTWTD
jgi:hypothetical protein